MNTETIRGMTYVSPFAEVKFRNRNSSEIERIYFPAAEKQFFNDIGIVTDVDTDSDPNTFLSSTSFYFDTNKNGRVGDAGDTFAFKMILHVSKNGNKIKEAYEVYSPNPGEILLFLEDNEGDFSDQILRAKVAIDVRERLKESLLYSDNVVDYVNRNFSLDHALLKQLIEKGYVEEGFTFSRDLMGGLHYAMRIVAAPSKAVGWLVTKIGEGVELLAIPDSIWDTESDEYFLKKENVIKDLTVDISFLDELGQKLQDDQTKLQVNDFIPDFITENLQKFFAKLKQFLQKYNTWVVRVVDALYKSFEDEAESIENFSGIPEGIAFYVGIWNGLIDFIASTLKFVGGILESPYNLSKDRQEILESVDSMFDMLAEINLSDVVEAFSAIYTKIKTFFKNASGEGYNYVHIAYAVGFGIAFVGTFFIPFTQLAKFANLQKISKIIPANFFKDLSGIVSKSTTHLAGKTKNAYLNSLKLFEQLLAVFAKGKASITAFLEQIWKKIAAWLVKNKKAFEGIGRKIKDAFSKEGKTEEFFRKIEKKFNLAGEEILSISDIKKLRRLLQENFKVPLELLEGNRALKLKLKNWQERRVAGSFDPIAGIMYLRKNVTAYTVQHEMFHMKLWYKMTKEFPDLAKAYEKSIGNKLFHEEYVLSEFMKKLGKWDEVDLLNDLAEINRLRNARRLPEVNLEFFKKWSLEEEILKLRK